MDSLRIRSREWSGRRPRERAAPARPRRGAAQSRRGTSAAPTRQPLTLAVVLPNDGPRRAALNQSFRLHAGE